jgi:PPM family protein phosphatase
VRVSQAAADSNTGRKRRHNEDAFVAAPPVFAVADGMGGAQAGEVASSLAAETIEQNDVDPGGSGEERVIALIKAANRRVHYRATSDAAASGMGTTMTVALVQEDGTVAIGHVGDSRAYRLRDGELEQLTEDHSLVAELVRRGELSPEEAAVHPQRSVITRALGTEPDVDVDAFTVEARDGDLFLLCSDGLTSMVDVRTIAEILERNRASLAGATSALIKTANDRGGDDNITAVVFGVEDGDQPTLPVAAAAVAAADPDDEDTLHPEDGVPAIDYAPTDLTMIVPASAIAAQAAAQAGAQPGTSEPSAEPAEKASTARLILALIVIGLLAAAIVALVLEALPR